MANSSTRKRRYKSARQVAAWRSARIQNYARRLSADSLAQMLVDLEDSSGNLPEFEIDDEWPAAVEHMRIK